MDTLLVSENCWVVGESSTHSYPLGLGAGTLLADSVVVWSIDLWGASVQ